MDRKNEFERVTAKRDVRSFVSTDSTTTGEKRFETLPRDDKILDRRSISDVPLPNAKRWEETSFDRSTSLSSSYGQAIVVGVFQLFDDAFLFRLFCSQLFDFVFILSTTSFPIARGLRRKRSTLCPRWEEKTDPLRLVFARSQLLKDEQGQNEVFLCRSIDFTRSKAFRSSRSFCSRFL